MDKAELTALKRRVGHMTREQVAPLLEDARKRREARYKNGCPDCHYERGNNWHHCAAYKAMAVTPPTLANNKLLRQHRENCMQCYVESQWEELSSYCEKCEELYDIFHAYSQRITRIECNEKLRRFKQANGRDPLNVLEFEIWLDAEKS